MARKRSERKAFGDARGVSPASRRESYENTGTFGAFRQPRLVGVSDAVRVSTRHLVRDAKRAERAWKRSLPKGVKV
jgi:hypothetical protein